MSIANALLLRLGLVPEESSGASPRSKGATVILHVPRPAAPQASRGDAIQPLPSQAPPRPVLPRPISPSPISPSTAPPDPVPTANVPHVPPALFRPALFRPAKFRPTEFRPALRRRAKSRPLRQRRSSRRHQAAAVPAAEPAAPAAKVTSQSPQPKQPTRSNSTTLILVSAAAIILVAAIFFFARKHYAPPVAKTPAAPSVRTASPPRLSSAPSRLRSRTNNSRTISACFACFFRHRPRKSCPVDDQPPARVRSEPGHASCRCRSRRRKSFSQRKTSTATHSSRRSCAFRISSPRTTLYKSLRTAFRILPSRRSAFARANRPRLIFNLQPQPRLASLTIQGGAPGTTVLVDQTLVGTIQPDGTLSVSTVNPGDHTVELRKERFKPRQFKKHFVAGGTISLAAADAALEAVPGELKITFAPADATVAIVKGDLLKMVSSGVPLNLAPGTYTLTARTAERFTRSSTLEVIAGQSKTLDLSLAPSGMSKWDDPGAWKHERDSFIRKGGDFVLYGAVPASGTFVFSAMLTKGHLLAMGAELHRPQELRPLSSGRQQLLPHGHSQRAENGRDHRSR